MKLLTTIALLLWGTACDWQSPSSLAIQLNEESQKRGIDYIYSSGGSPQHRLPEIMGGGAALFDSDNDGDLDLFFVQSSSLDEHDSRIPNSLYENDGFGNFSKADGADATLSLGYSMGVAIGDVNNDSLSDILITSLNENVLLLNQGNNQFNNVTESSGLSNDEWSTAAAFADLDLDGDLDLWVVNYIEWHEAMEPECYQIMLGSRDYCSPSHYNEPARDRVFRNDGDGTFTDVTRSANVYGTKGNGLGIVTSDFDEDGYIDVFVANDTSPNHLWLNQGDFQFKESCELWNCALDQHGVARAGMGVVATDIDNDLDQDLVVVNITTEPDYVFQNNRRFFRDIASRVGLSISTQRFTRFGLIVEDLNNDGFVDIFEANGSVSRLPNPHNGDRFAEPNSLFLGDESGKFTQLDYSESVRTSRAAAVGDINNDGLLDIVVVNRDTPVELLMNNSKNQNNWLIVNVLSENRRVALGAKVEIGTDTGVLSRTVQAASSYLTSRDPRVHFGLGPATNVNRLTVKWLNGKVLELSDVQVNQILTICSCDV